MIGVYTFRKYQPPVTQTHMPAISMPDLKVLRQLRLKKMSTELDQVFFSFLIFHLKNGFCEIFK